MCVLAAAVLMLLITLSQVSRLAHSSSKDEVELLSVLLQVCVRIPTGGAHSIQARGTKEPMLRVTIMWAYVASRRMLVTTSVRTLYH